MMKWSIVIGPEPVNIFQSRPADGPLTSRFALLWNNYLFQIVLQVFLGMSDHDEDEFYYPDEIQISVRWPTTVTAKANRSRQKQLTHGKTKSLTAKPNRSRQNQIRSRQNQIRFTEKTWVLGWKEHDAWWPSKMFCQNCGCRMLSEEAKFCTQCGTGKINVTLFSLCFTIVYK